MPAITLPYEGATFNVVGPERSVLLWVAEVSYPWTERRVGGWVDGERVTAFTRAGCEKKIERVKARWEERNVVGHEG